MNTIRLKKLLKNHFENGFSFYFILFLLFIGGIVIGSLIIKALSENTVSLILKLSSPYFFNSLNANYSSFNIFKTSIIFNLLFVIIAYIIGLLNLGFIVPILIFLKGGSIGISVGYLIFSYGWRGFLISIFGCYPQYLLYIPCIIFIGALSMTISFKYRLNSNRRVVKLKRLYFADYTIFIIFFASLLLLGSIYEGFISPFFLNLVNDILV